MSKTLIGLIFILVGVSYGSLAIDDFNKRTLGWLVANGWVKPPQPGKDSLSPITGPKLTIFLYSFGLIIIGLFILWKQ